MIIFERIFFKVCELQALRALVFTVQNLGISPDLPGKHRSSFVPGSMDHNLKTYVLELLCLQEVHRIQGSSCGSPTLNFYPVSHVTDTAGPDNIFGNTVPEGHHLFLCQCLFESYVNISKSDDSWLTLGIWTQTFPFDNC